ncbi:MAG: hypothetical protein Q4F81_08785 [Eubacteriales bacterium]|nr:hypothetical protein [Eubacteriales bacterium]
MGMHRRTPPAARFYTILEGFGKAMGADAAANEKIFRFFKIFICICGKMGYNRRKASETQRAQAQRKSQ